MTAMMKNGADVNQRSVSTLTKALSLLLLEHHARMISKKKTSISMTTKSGLVSLEVVWTSASAHFRPTGEPPRLGVIFRGTGKRISQDEKEAYHPDVDVYYQENAWANTKVSFEWVQKTLSPSVKDDERFVLFCDNLTAQVSNEYKECVSQLNGVVWYGLPNATDLWQPVDAGYGQILKTLICQAQRRWLDDDENAEKWYGHDSYFTSKERRILITHWIGEAYEKLTSAEYDHLAAAASVAEDRVPDNG